ncbi:type IV secretory system conjugative DNA transfer family protein, partial [Salipiger pacificus]|nr:type IV secretory system conjugative DNA transfer family protein [Alloyangia pacifica]
DPALIDNAEMISGLLCPCPDSMSEEDKYWPRAAGAILTGCMVYLCLSPKHRCTLPALHDLVRRTKAEWADLATDMGVVDTRRLKTYAKKILEPLGAEKQWAGIMGQIDTATAIYGPSKALGGHVARDEFDPALLKQEALTVYLVIPSNRRDANKQWLALVMSLCAEAVGRPGKSRPVLLLAEEFANLGLMPSITRAMAEYREAGLKVWLIVQNMHQLRRIYGREGAEEIVNLCRIRQYFSIDEVELAKDIEAHLGTVTKESTSYGHELSFSQVGVPLKRVQDILRMRLNEQIILSTGPVPPIKAKLRPYYQSRRMRSLADPNPYREA